MKTYRVVINKGFMETGLFPSNLPTRNSGYFTDCRNVRVTKFGLEGYLPVIEDILDPKRTFYDATTLAALTITRQWPFPQVFLTDVGIFIGAKEGLYKVTDPNPDTLPKIYLVDYETGDTIWPWTYLPILGYPAFLSGNRFIYYDENTLSYVVVS